MGYCGIVCSDCPVLIATQRNDDAERRRVAELFYRQYEGNTSQRILTVMVA